MSLDSLIQTDSIYLFSNSSDEAVILCQKIVMFSFYFSHNKDLVSFSSVLALGYKTS